MIIVDDHAALRTAVGAVLASAGYAVKTFASAEELLRDGVGDAHCLVLDVALPGMSGLEAHERLKAYSTCPPVIFYTGCEDAEGRVRTQALQGGALAFLRKPFEGDDLLEAVSCACAKANGSGAP